MPNNEQAVEDSSYPGMGARLLAALKEHCRVERMLLPLALALWPDLKHMNEQRRLVGTGEVLTTLYATPLALAGLLWLLAVTDLDVFFRHWPVLLFLGAAMFLFRRLGFFIIAEIRAGRYASVDGSLESMALWVAALLYGPSALWMAVFWVFFARPWERGLAPIDRWMRIRNMALYLANNTLAMLVALRVYIGLGGSFPLPNLSPQALWPAFAAIAVYLLAQMLVWSGYIAYALWTQRKLTGDGPLQPVLRFFLNAMVLPALAHPFGALMAGVYSQNGPVTFGIFFLGMVLVALLARRLSWAAEMGRQKSRQLEKLELLGRAILASPPDASTLPQILTEYVPVMFPSGRVVIWLSSGDVLALHPVEWEIDLDEVWEWMSTQRDVCSFLSNAELPWGDPSLPHNPLVLAPIFDVDVDQPNGMVYLELYNLAQPWDRASLANLFPAVQSLAAQVGLALHQAGVYEQALAYQRVSQELSLAGKIQSSFLPDELPLFSGWQLAVTLLPARETSGDYFDFITLSNGKLGILIADVTDKGVGAALYMALSRTLIRTYAIEFDEDPMPEVIFFAANNRLLQDARADLFVTAFYGILDPDTGELMYCNAGHNPPYLVQGEGEAQTVLPLWHTGMPLGVDEDTVWGRGVVQIRPGDVLILYTDGIPDSQNKQGEFMGDGPLIASALGSASLAADDIQANILETVQDFTGGGAQFDDITLLVLVRDAEAVSEDETETEAGAT